MEKERIKEEMSNLEKILQFRFNDISWLAKAMGSVKTESSDYENEGLAFVGDAILKAILSDALYTSSENRTKGHLTNERIDLENNKVLHALVKEEGILDFAYSEKHFYKDESVPDNERVVSGQHDVYIEAIVAAIYYDSGYDKTCEWVNDWLLPKLKVESENTKK